MKPGLAARRTFGPSRALAAAALFCALVAPWRALAGTEPAVARFSWSGGQPPPAAVHVVPPSVEFGQVVALVVDAEPGTPLPPTGALAVDADWLVPDLAAPPPDLSALPAAAGPRLVVPMRIYHLGPWRAAWGDDEIGEVLVVEGRLDRPGEIMPVRDPRAIGGIPRWFLWVLAPVSVVLAWWLLYRCRARRRPGPSLAGIALQPPAWLNAALHLRDLDRDPVVAQHSGRAFLDRLAHILRAYMQGRYHLPALEMTADEIMAAGRAAGWPREQLEAFCALLQESDLLRYAPPAVSAVACRRLFGAVLDLIEDVRIEPVWSPIPPGRLAEAAAAWDQLRARYPRLAGPRERAAC